MRRGRQLLAVLGALALCATLFACGESESETATLTPEDVRQNLIDAGFEVSEPITEGANQGVAQNGKLDADSLVSVESSPAGERVYASVYFFSLPQDAEILDAEFDREDDKWGAHELRWTRVYNISGTQEQLDAIVEAGEGG